MVDPYAYPKLRWPLDVRMDRAGDTEVLVLSCPVGVTVNPLGLLAAVAPVVGCFDGRHSIDDILGKFRPAGLERPVVDQLVQLLDQHYFLETPRFVSQMTAVKAEFHARSDRPAALAGLSYPGDADGLRAMVNGYLGVAVPPLILPAGKLVGAMAPHIDYRRGGISYGIGYKFLDRDHHDLYLLIGTSHQYSPHMFHLTRKHFHSPLGTLACDVDFVDELAVRYGRERSFADEMLHRREHSLELQLPFLAALKPTAKIVPVLIGSLHEAVASQRLPHELDVYEEFAAALTEIARARLAQGARVCILAGVDMAHIGRSFGDTGSLSPERMDAIKIRDEAYLAALRSGDPAKLFAHIEEDGDARRICGFPTMYLVLDVLKRLGIETTFVVYDYRQAVDYKTDCAVTFASGGFYERAAA